MTKKELGNHLIGAGESKLTIVCILEKRLNWTQAKEDLGINTCAALFISSIRLIFWHWMQPFLYAFVLFAYWDLLDKGQQILGLIVAVREGIYFLLATVCIFVNPSYLLVDLRATWQKELWATWYEDIENKSLALMYAVAPEKYILMCISGNKNEDTGIGSGICLSLLDLSGIIAFIWAIVVNNVYPAMMIGYGVTTLGGLCFIALLCFYRFN